VAEDKGSGSGEELDVLLGDEEEDVIFKLRMLVVNTALGYWKHAIGFACFVLAVAFFAGTWVNHKRDTQQGIHAEVAKVERRIEKLATAEGATDPLGGFSGAVLAPLTEQAVALETIAASAVGPGAAYAWILAANLYDSLDKEEDAARCWAGAHALDQPGVIGWSAASGHASSLSKAGQVDEAVATVKPIADGEAGGVVEEEAQLALARIFLDAGRTAEGIQAMEHFLTRFPESDLITQVHADLESARVAG
jgi:hypothetical protein